MIAPESSGVTVVYEQDRILASMRPGHDRPGKLLLSDLNRGPAALQ